MISDEGQVSVDGELKVLTNEVLVILTDRNCDNFLIRIRFKFDADLVSDIFASEETLNGVTKLNGFLNGALIDVVEIIRWRSKPDSWKIHSKDVSSITNGIRLLLCLSIVD